MATSDQILRIILKMVDDASPQMSAASKNLRNMGQMATQAGAALTAGLTVPLVAAAAAGVKAASDLDAEMRNIQSVSKQTDSEIRELSDTFVKMSMNADLTRDSARNLAAGFYDIQGSGFAGADAMKVLEASTKAASAGLTTTEVAAQAITAQLNAYGMGAEHAAATSDIMFRTVDRGVGTFEELAGALGNVMGTASQANVGFDEVSAALATMSKQGINFNEGATALNTALLAFVKPTEAMKDAIEAAGYASGSAMLDALGFAGALNELYTQANGSREALVAMFGNMRGVRAVFSLTGEGAQMFAADLEAMNSATGATAEAFAIQMQSFQAQWDVFKNTLQAAGISIGETLLPLLANLLKIITPMVAAFANAGPAVHIFAVAIGALLAAIGPLLLIVGQFATAISAIGGLMGTLGVTAGGAGAAIAAVGAAAGPVIVIIGALAAIILTVAKHWSLFEQGAKVAEIAFKSFAQNAIPQAITNFKSLLDQFVQIEKNLAMQVLKPFVEIARQLPQAFRDLPRALSVIGTEIIKSLLQGLKTAWNALVQWFTQAMADLQRQMAAIWKMHSPSKVAVGWGENIAAGWQEGLAGLQDASIMSPSLSVPSVAGAGAGAGMGGGGVNITIQTLNVPPGTTQGQIQDLMKQLAREIQKQGGFNLIGSKTRG